MVVVGLVRGGVSPRVTGRETTDRSLSQDVRGPKGEGSGFTDVEWRKGSNPRPEGTVAPEMEKGWDGGVRSE